MKQRILITGSSGLLGHQTTALLSATGLYEIYALQQSPSELPDVKTIQISLSNPEFVHQLPDNIDAVMHLAQSNYFRQFPEKATDIFAVNSHATLQLIDYARRAGASRFIYTSTGGVYSGSQASFTESDVCNVDASMGFYAMSKFIGEKLIEHYSAIMHTLIFRPFFIYGTRQKPDMLIPRLLNNIREGKAIGLDGENGLHINPIHVQDAAQAMMKAISYHQSDIFNLGGPEVLSLREIGELMASELHVKANFESNLTRTPRDVVGDIHKLSQLLYTPTITFRQGLHKLITHEE
jgi:nucleoside-diphosphate-sugar epimerase